MFDRVYTRNGWVEGGFKVETAGDEIKFEKVHEFDEPMDEVAIQRVCKEAKNSSEFMYEVHLVMLDAVPGTTFNQIMEKAQQNYNAKHVNNYPYGR